MLEENEAYIQSIQKLNGQLEYANLIKILF
jgi:hypothetical protein